MKILKNDGNKLKEIINNCFKKLFTFKSFKAFSVIELTISLVAIGVIAMGAGPVVTKKMNSFIQSGGVYTLSCSNNFSSDCKFCSATRCVICMKKECSNNGGGYNNDKCACCPNNCVSCEKDKNYCTSCVAGKILSGTAPNQKCDSNCPAGKYCPRGTNEIITCPAGS